MVGDDDPWDAALDQLTTAAVLEQLQANHRSALIF